MVRTRHDIPRPVVWLLWPLYRRSESRSDWGTGSVYILRGLGSRHGPVLRVGVRRRGASNPPGDGR